MKGLDQIVVTRRVPAVHILLSLDEIDSKTLGHQTTNVPTKFWPVPKKVVDDDYVFRQRKKTAKFNKQYQRSYGEGSSHSKRSKGQKEKEKP